MGLYTSTGRQLSQKHVVLDVIHVATGIRVYFDFYTSNGVFTAGLFQSFYVTHPYGHQDKRTTDNKGFTSRKALTAQSKSVQMMGKLHLDLFCQEKYLLNHVALKINLRRDVFALMADADNFKASMSTQPITILFGNCPKNMLSWT
jgi:hypothetical protein